MKHPELGRWVWELILNKKVLREKGLEYEPETEPITAEEDADMTVTLTMLPTVQQQWQQTKKPNHPTANDNPNGILCFSSRLHQLRLDRYARPRDVGTTPQGTLAVPVKKRAISIQ